MEKNQIISVEELKEAGYKYVINYGFWQVWAKDGTRIYWDKPSGKIAEIHISNNNAETTNCSF